VYRAIDLSGQVIDVLVSEKRDLAATRRFLRTGPGPTASGSDTDRAQAYPRVLDELLPTACHVRQKYANNPIEADHGRLKSRLRPMRGLKKLRCARVISAGHAFVQNLRDRARRPPGSAGLVVCALGYVVVAWWVSPRGDVEV
jgi:IS6 family transposase